MSKPEDPPPPPGLQEMPDRYDTHSNESAGSHVSAIKGDEHVWSPHKQRRLYLVWQLTMAEGGLS